MTSRRILLQSSITLALAPLVALGKRLLGQANLFASWFPLQRAALGTL
jgi:hypothetical protein